MKFQLNNVPSGHWRLNCIGDGDRLVASFWFTDPAGTPEEWERWVANLHDLMPAEASYEQLRHALCVRLGIDDSGFDTDQ
jgi:hypothetical protein